MGDGNGAAAARADLGAHSLTDDELVSLAGRGVAAGFHEIMRRNNRRLYRTARAVLRDDVEAEDVVQEAYMRAFQALSSFRGEAGLATWLTRIVYNEAVGRLRRRRTAVDVGQIDLAAAEGGGARILAFTAATHGEGADPERSAARRELRQLLEEAIDALPGRFRVVLLARDVDGMSGEEAAEALGLQPETVRTRLHRARRLLRAAIEDRVGEAMEGAFPFDGRRCRRLTARVMTRLSNTGTLEPAASSPG